MASLGFVSMASEEGENYEEQKYIVDLDSDGIPNCEDPDDDGDDIKDTEDEFPHDHDNDGISDFKDDDDDNDGILDTEDDDYVGNCEGLKEKRQRHKDKIEKRREKIRELKKKLDLDSDGIPDCEDPDDDGDGISDTEDEFPHDHDNDGIPDFKDDDDDNDGILDTEDDDYVGNCKKRVKNKLQILKQQKNQRIENRKSRPNKQEQREDY